jgi:hypothetical protein
MLDCPQIAGRELHLSQRFDLAELQAAVDRGADLPSAKHLLLYPADLPQARRDHPRPRVLQLPRAGAEEKALEDRIAALGRSGSWSQIIAGLDSLTETEIEQDGKRFVVRSAPRPAASLALGAVGVALPPTDVPFSYLGGAYIFTRWASMTTLPTFTNLLKPRPVKPRLCTAAPTTMTCC